jgi:glycosyltransferase involved in cell wall biosynthesis
MKIAYLAPELPALSATFVYNEILQLEALGTEVIPFSVHVSSSDIREPRVKALAEKTFNLYAQSKLSVLKDNFKMLIKHPVRYLKTMGMLCADMWRVGLFSRTARGLGYRMMFSASLATHLINKKCDHLHVHFAHIPTDIAMYASSLSNIPYSVTAHANDIYERGWLLKEKVQRSAFFATISEFNKRYLATQGVDLDKIKIIRCGVDPAQFSRREEFVSNSTPKIGVIGRLVGKKGIDTLINAVALLKKQGQAVALHIAGSGPLENTLKQLVMQNDLTESKVNFLGPIPHSEVAGFIKSLDMFVLPCKQDENGDIDGIPVVLMEAMLSGVPVISTELSGIPELVINNETGLIAEPDNINALASVIIQMINDQTLREKISYNAVIKVKDDFSLYNNTSKLNDLFRNNTKVS